MAKGLRQTSTPRQEGKRRTRGVLKRLWRDRSAVAGALLVFALVATAVLGQWVTPHPATVIDIQQRWFPPSVAHPFGTDFFGRDVFSRIIIGSRVSLLVGLVTLGINTIIGVPVGVIAGYYGGTLDNVLMRVGDILLSFPTLLFAMALMSVRGVGITEIVIALTFKGWVEIARLVRSEVLSVKEREYTRAAVALGSSDMRVLVKHALPNSLAAFIAYAPLGMTTPILAEASLSFLGLGIQAPAISWGQMISGEWTYIRDAWWPVVFPGLAIGITVLGFSLLGDALRDALDTRL